jgi:hypothetical protein
VGAVGERGVGEELSRHRDKRDFDRTPEVVRLAQLHETALAHLGVRGYRR